MIEAAKRELFEETGVQLPTDLEPVGVATYKEHSRCTRDCLHTLLLSGQGGNWRLHCRPSAGDVSRVRGLTAPGHGRCVQF
jgi:8-oxo-dGTP pyrophosphatase MutT (NUDIX family)